jgi:hypothetical protein
MTPAAASKVRPSGLGCEGVTIFSALQANASTWIIQSNGHGAQDAYIRLCMSFLGGRFGRPAGGSGNRSTVSVHDGV